MTWLKLTSKALYLMQGNAECFLDKVETKIRPSGESELQIPLNWFQDNDAPGSMVISMQAPDQTQTCQSKPISTLGIDVSAHQGKNIDWQAVMNSGVSYAFVKATEGRTFVDDAFARNWKEMKRVGLLRGAYHFFLPDRDASIQAANFLQTVNLEKGDLPPVLDLEETKGIQPDDILKGAKQWLDKVEQATNRKPIIYTSPNFWKNILRNPTTFSEYPLWIAHYTSDPQPIVPGGWSKYTFWQHTDRGAVAGVQGAVDRNRFNGTPEKLLDFANS